MKMGLDIQFSLHRSDIFDEDVKVLRQYGAFLFTQFLALIKVARNCLLGLMVTRKVITGQLFWWHCCIL